MTKERNYLFDNYKVFLIYLVVLGHFVSPSFKDGAFLEAVKWFIFAFHMPAFMFVSGFFSKKAKPAVSLVQKLLIPYLIFELLYFAVYTIIGKDTELALMYPKFTLWYLFSVFVYKLITPKLMKLPFPVVFAGAVILGFLMGFSPAPGSLFTNQRMVYFYPYFLLGVYMNTEHVEKLRTKKWKAAGTVVIVLFLLFLAFDGIHKGMPVSVTYGRYSYASLDQTAAVGLLVKGLCYIFGFALTLAFLSVMPGKKNCLSWIGPNTLAVYLFHGLFFKILETRTTILQDLTTPVECAGLLLACAVVTFVFALKPFNRFTNMVSSIPLGSLTEKKGR